MKIIVCPLSSVRAIVELHAPERIVSLLDPEFDFPEFGSAYLDNHLRLHFHDTHGCTDSQIAPSAEQVQQLLKFLSSWTRSAPLLIHCRAGIGRSSAVGFISACLHNPATAELSIALALRNASPLARPNELLVELADKAMSRSGRMLQSIRETGRDLTWHGVSENVPFELTLQ
jgi:predicted protein tyrosine phosphatase